MNTNYTLLLVVAGVTWVATQEPANANWIKDAADRTGTYITDSTLGKFVKPADRNQRDRERIMSVLSYDRVISVQPDGEVIVLDQRKLDSYYRSLQGNGALNNVYGFSPSEDKYQEKSGQFWRNFFDGKDHTRGETPEVMDSFANASRGLATKMHTQLATATDEASTSYAETASTLKVRNIDIMDAELRRGVANGARVYIEALDKITAGQSSKAVEWAEKAAALTREDAKTYLQGRIRDELTEQLQESLKNGLGEKKYDELMKGYEKYTSEREKLEAMINDLSRLPGGAQLKEVADRLQRLTPEGLAEDMLNRITATADADEKKDDKVDDDIPLIERIIAQGKKQEGIDVSVPPLDPPPGDDASDTIGDLPSDAPDDQTDDSDMGDDVDGDTPPDSDWASDDDTSEADDFAADDAGEMDDAADADDMADDDVDGDMEDIADDSGMDDADAPDDRAGRQRGGTADESDPDPSGDLDSSGDDDVAGDPDIWGTGTPDDPYRDFKDPDSLPPGIYGTGTKDDPYRDYKNMPKNWRDMSPKERDDFMRGAEAAPDPDKSTIPSGDPWGGDGALDQYADARQSDRQQKTSSAGTTMGLSSQMGEASRAGDQQSYDAKQIRSAGGRDAQDIKDDAARKSAQKQRQDSWGNVIGSAVADGIQQGAEAFGSTLGAAAADEVSGQIFGTRKDRDSSSRDSGDDGDMQTAAAPSGGGDATPSGGRQRTPSSGQSSDSSDDDNASGEDSDSSASDDPLGVRDTVSNEDGTVTITYGCRYTWTGTPPGPSRCPICARETISTESNQPAPKPDPVPAPTEPAPVTPTAPAPPVQAPAPVTPPPPPPSDPAAPGTRRVSGYI